VARYARHIVLAEIGGAGQQRLKAARVLVIGAGGLGSPVLSYLAAAGVGLLGVIDDDEVSLSNLQRQILHDTANVGMDKTESAARSLASGSTRTPGWSPTSAADGGQCGGCADRL
jgi:molybdopterin/thiamine biosynthesis adenylyltransferase